MTTARPPTSPDLTAETAPPEARADRAEASDAGRASLLAPASRVADALRRGLCPTDGAFDRFLPEELRLVSRLYWTPLEVVTRAARWLRELDVRTVIDIGSGAGKFCVAASLATPRARFLGLEQRSHLVAVARDLAQRYDVGDRVQFTHGALADVALPEAHAYYLYNPFGENLLDRRDRLDDTVELGDACYIRDLAATKQLLRQARVGTYLMTYNGFGGRVPATFEEVRVDRELSSVLRMWRKVTPTASG